LDPPLPAAELAGLPAAGTLVPGFSHSSTATASTSQGTPTSSSSATAAATAPANVTAAHNETLIGSFNLAQVFIPNTVSGYTLFGFWVNGTTLNAYTTENIVLSASPPSPFPFARLAIVGRSTSVFLYHELNSTTFVEDVYNTDGGFWTSSNFSIETT
jgi:hypothetical protein